jgi:hypothetical protein
MTDPHIRILRLIARPPTSASFLTGAGRLGDGRSLIIVGLAPRSRMISPCVLGSVPEPAPRVAGSDLAVS